MSNAKNPPAKHFQEAMEKGASQARETYEQAGAAATAGADFAKESYSY